MITVINPKSVKYIFCPDCKRRTRAEFHENGKQRWVIVRQCGNCGFKKLLLKEEVDSIQPSSQLWDMVYGDDPFKDTERRKMMLEQNEQKRKENLEKQYEMQFKGRRAERDYVKKRVLKEDNYYGL